VFASLAAHRQWLSAHLWQARQRLDLNLDLPAFLGPVVEPFRLGHKGPHMAFSPAWKPFFHASTRSFRISASSPLSQFVDQASYGLDSTPTANPITALARGFATSPILTTAVAPGMAQLLPSGGLISPSSFMPRYA
jgi:hypothetical protein